MRLLRLGDIIISSNLNNIIYTLQISFTIVLHIWIENVTFPLFLSLPDSMCPLTLQQQADKGNRKRYLPADKDRPGSPLSKRVAMSPDRGEKLADT